MPPSKVVSADEVVLSGGVGLSGNAPVAGALNVTPAGQTAAVLNVNGRIFRVLAGDADPTGTVEANVGSVYLRGWQEGTVNRGGAYVNVGPNSTDWQKIAG